jgi:hypothetical protein
MRGGEEEEKSKLYFANPNLSENGSGRDFLLRVELFLGSVFNF